MMRRSTGPSSRPDCAVARSVRSDRRLDAGFALACVLLAALALILPRRTREGFAATLRTTVLSPLVAIEGRAASVRAAILARNDVLVSRGQVATQSLRVQAVAAENRTLRKLLGLSARLQDGFVAADLLPSRGAGDEFSIALATGSDAGVQPFLPVVTADGIVGMVQSVDRATSFAITWAHPDFRVSAMSIDEGAFGIVQPHLGAGAERWLLEMRGVPFRARLEPGTLIVSSGLGATYPRGIPVGTVLGELATPEKWARTYLVKPSVLPEAIGPVLVLLSSRTQRGVNGVWTTVNAADSAARAMAAAGDSLARSAAFDELTARRAALEVAADTLADSTLAFVSRRRAIPPDSARADSARMRPDRAVRAPTRPDTAKPRVIVPPSAPRTGPPPAFR
jgi:rod shape-determining protein MreC